MDKMQSFDEYYSIKSIMSRVSEGLNSPLVIEWNKTDDLWLGHFKVDERSYEIKIKRILKFDHWFFKFSSNNSYEMTNDIKKAFSVLPTIESAMMQFIEEVSPEVLMYCAADDSSARKKLYTTFSERMCKKYNLSFYTENNEQAKQQIFILHKHLFDGIKLAQSVAYIANHTLSGASEDI